MLCLKCLVRAGRDAPMAKTMLVSLKAGAKQACGAARSVARHVRLLQLGHGTMGWPCRSCDDGWPLGLCGGLDRNGLRPMRYVVTGDGLLDCWFRGGNGS